MSNRPLLHLSALAPAVIGALLPFSSSSAQVAVPLGAGSYASEVPTTEYYEDAYYGLPAAQVEPLSTAEPAIFDRLHLDPSLAGKPIPTNQWWTDLLIGNRSGLPPGESRYNLQQDDFGGNLWFYPGAIDPRSHGFDVFFPTAWTAPNANGSPQGAIEKGPALQIRGAVPYTVPAGDILIADFENGYGAGTVVTNTVGTAFTPVPSAGIGLNGVTGQRCASTRDNGDNPQGKISFPEFTVASQHLHFRICGGSSADTQVRLVVDGEVVAAASGQNSLNFRWVSWDLSPWTGMTARVEVVDQSSGGWGIICCDQIVLSDAADPTSRYGGDFVSTGSVVTGWGDWNVDFALPDANGNRIDLTLARGVPFTWTKWTGSVQPRIMAGGVTLHDSSNQPIDTSGGSFTASAFAFDFQGRTYGVFLPDATTVTVGADFLQPLLSGADDYMVIGYLPSAADLARFEAVAFARPTATALDWSHDPAAGLVHTTWTIDTTPLKGGNLDTLQGWLPHHYRTTDHEFGFEPFTYLTPRGTMKCAAGRSFQIAFPFKGITPAPPAPRPAGLAHDFQPARMRGFLDDFSPGGMMGDTYWGGKALALCAQNLWFAMESGDAANTNRLRAALHDAMVDWLTYTPGETDGFFADYPNWRALIGSNASYGSQAFNDLHFHYGYFAVAGATLGMVDPRFLDDYGPMLEKVAKCYGNWDRADDSAPFLRTFDIWAGHSNAGGMSSGNGNNQESSSEATQSWAGLFLLGGALENDGMQAAGAMGFAMESCAVNEYWQDLHEENFPAGYNRAGTGILTADSYAYATYFSGDPAWVYGIQYAPSQHWLNYMTRGNPATLAAKWQAMWTERANYCAGFTPWDGATAFNDGVWIGHNQKVYSAKGDVAAGNPPPDVNNAQWQLQVDGSLSKPEVLGGGLGHCLMVYQGLWDPETAVADFDSAFTAGKSIATNPTDAGSTYFLIHASRQLGGQDDTHTTGIPTSAVYLHPGTGVRTFVVYNPKPVTESATVYQNGSAIGTMTIPGRSLVSTTDPDYQPAAPPAPDGLSAVSNNGAVELAWNPAPTATAYQVKRSTDGGVFTVIASPATPGFTDTTPAPGQTCFYVVSAVNSIGESADSAVAAVTAFGPPLAAIHCGGTTAAGSFAADTAFTGGATSTSSAAIDTSGVASPAPAAVYQRYRFGNFSYTLGGLVPGNAYKVRLHFAELYWNAAGARTGNVSINGTQVLANFDAFAAAGGKNKAVVREFTATATPVGELVIAFATTKDNAICNGIEIRTPDPAAPDTLTAEASGAQVLLTWNPAAGTTGYNIKRSATPGGPYAIIGSTAATGFTDTAAAPGTLWRYVVTGINADGESPDSNEATTSTGDLAPLDQWRLAAFGTTDPAHPLGGDLASPRNDGVANLIKYVLGLDPLQPATAGLPAASVTGGVFQFTFIRMKSATDIIYHVDAASSPGELVEIWNSSGVPYGGGENPSEQVTVPDIVPPAGRRFMRLRVTQPE